MNSYMRRGLVALVCLLTATAFLMTGCEKTTQPEAKKPLTNGSSPFALAVQPAGPVVIPAPPTPEDAQMAAYAKLRDLNKLFDRTMEWGKLGDPTLDPAQ